MAGLVPAIHVFRIARVDARLCDGRQAAGMTEGTEVFAPRRCIAVALSVSACSARSRLRAGLPQSPGQNRRAVSGRRRHRRADAVRRSRHGAAARSALHRREPRRRRHHPRRDRRRPLRTRRLHHHGRHRVDLCGRARPLQASGLRSDQGLLADHAVRDRAVRAGGEPIARGQLGQGTDRSRQEQAGRTRLRLRRCRRRASHLLRTVHDHDRNQNEARALSRRRDRP